jgi:hypothetical protein
MVACDERPFMAMVSAWLWGCELNFAKKKPGLPNLALPNLALQQQDFSQA